MIIAIEGIDGAGKTGICKELARRASALIRLHGNFFGLTNVQVVRSPGGNSLGQQFRALALDPASSRVATLLTMQADKAQTAHELTMGLHRFTTLYLLDRWHMSTLAYQGAMGFPRKVILELNALAGPDADLNILVDLPPEVGLSRKNVQGEVQRFESEGVTFMGSVAQHFQAESILGSEVRIVDGTLPEDRVQSLCWSYLESYLAQHRQLNEAPGEEPCKG